MPKPKQVPSILPQKSVLYGVEWEFPGNDHKFERMIVARNFDHLKKIMNAYGAQSFVAEVATREVFA